MPRVPVAITSVYDKIAPTRIASALSLVNAPPDDLQRRCPRTDFPSFARRRPKILMGRAMPGARNICRSPPETCFMFTFRAVAQASKFQFLSLELSGAGTVDRKEGATRFTEIVLKPRLKIPKGVDRDRAMRMLEKGEKACLVTAPLSTSVRLEPEIVIEA